MTATASILSLPIARIAIRQRIGFYHPDFAAALAASIAAEGQHDPIHVQALGDDAWALIAGLHRLRAVEIAGGDTIRALQVADANTDAATLLRLELSENLDRRQPRPIERAMFMAARARVEEAIDYPDYVGEPSQNRAGRARQAATNVTFAAGGWQARTAAAFKCHPKTFREYRLIYRSIVEPLPALAERLNAHALADNLAGLLRLAKIPTVEGREKIIGIILADPDIPTFDEAFVRADASSPKGVQPSIRDRYYTRFFNNWDRFDLGTKRAAAAELVRRMPAGMQADFLRELQAELAR